MDISPELTQRLENIASREGRTPDDLLASLLDAYEITKLDNNADSLEAFIGMFDDDITDLSIRVNDTLKQIFKVSDDSTT